MRTLLLPSVLPSICLAASLTQTDWSGGGGTWGPVTEWGDTYFQSMYIDCFGSPSNLILEKTMSPIPLEHTVDGEFDGAYSVYSTDVNGDGHMDVLGAASDADDITWWENVDGSGTIWVEHTIDGEFDGASSVYSTDVNGDGHIDALGAARFADDITWWENVDGTGTIWAEHTIDGEFDGASSIYSTDVNGDGYVDVLGAASYSNCIAWWENVDGTGTIWAEHAVGAYAGAFSVHSADVNGDGDMDVLGAANDSNDITWWENVNGSGTTWVEHTIDGEFDYAISVYSADVNGDGHMDVLGAALLADDITWWENVDGSGSIWAEHTVDGEFDGAYSVYSTDVNGDGHMDVLGAALMADDITWWENVDGSGTIWVEHTVDGEFDSAFSVCSADISGDGYKDVLGAAYYADDITWWDLMEFSSGGALESSVLEVPESPDWQAIDWTSSEPSGTSVALQVRASDNSSSMGAWSDTLLAPCSLSGIVTDQDRYFQYRAILTTTASYATPVLHDLTVDWQPYTGTQGESSVSTASFALYGALPNPGLSNVAVVFYLPVGARVELTIFDVTGRAVHATSGEFSSGAHEVLVPDLACGVYIARMISGEFIAAQRFVVIE